MHPVLPERPINQFEPVQHSREKALRAYCPNIYTVKLGLEYVDLWLMHWPGPGRHLNYPPVKMGMERPKVSQGPLSIWTEHSIKLQKMKISSRGPGELKVVRAYYLKILGTKILEISKPFRVYLENT